MENPKRPHGEPVKPFLEPFPPQRNFESIKQPRVRPNPSQTQERLMFQGFIEGFEVRDLVCFLTKLLQVVPSHTGAAERAGKDGQQETETHLPQ